jgi:hypothetical protein
VTRLRAVYSDVRALGISAPIRVAYEASKRSGFHKLLFAAPRTPSGIRSTRLQFGSIIPISSTASERTLADARAILAEGLRVFGRRVPTGIAKPWSYDPNSGEMWPESPPWWKIDIRTERRLGDVKYVWEAARHRDLVVLGRATRLEPKGPWIGALTALLNSWCDRNQPERGINWYSSLELSLRAIAWSQVLGLAGDWLPEVTRARMDEQLLASAHHIMVELPYTLSSMRNNHLLGDALGLIVLARLFPQHRPAGRWGRLGEQLFAAQLGRHMRADGSMIEDSLSYHRFVLEMLIVRTLLGDAPKNVLVALRGASRHLASIGVFDGEMPQYGDWDEGRVLASSGDPVDVAGSAALGLTLVGEPVPLSHQDLDELAWYAPPGAGTGIALSEPTSRHAAVSGGIAYVRRGPWRVWFKVGAGPSHGHADLTSVWIQNRDRWIVADPGTGTYNGPLKVRNGFRMSSAHPVVRIDGHDQLGPHRAFRWLHAAHGHLAPVATVNVTTILFGWHDAYERLEPGFRVARAVLITDTRVAIVDILSIPGELPRLDLTVPLGPGLEFRSGCLVADNAEFVLFGSDEASSTTGDAHNFIGWTSRTYGSWQPATWVTWSPKASVSIWGIGNAPQIRNESGCDVVIDEVRLGVRWTTRGAELEISIGGNEAKTVVRA